MVIQIPTYVKGTTVPLIQLFLQQHFQLQEDVIQLGFPFIIRYYNKYSACSMFGKALNRKQGNYLITLFLIKVKYYYFLQRAGWCLHSFLCLPVHCFAGKVLFSCFWWSGRRAYSVAVDESHSLVISSYLLICIS